MKYIWQFFILFFFPFLGGIIATITGQEKIKFLKIFLSFSGAFLLSVSVLKLMPEIFDSNLPYVGYFILLGFLFQLFIDYFSKGVEHGHLHFHSFKANTYLSVFFALSAHAFMEGIAVGNGMTNVNSHDNLVFSIALHEMPAAFALVIVLLHSKLRKKRIYALLTLYSLMTVFGALFGQFLSEIVAPEVMVYLTATAIGVFLHISTTIIFETNENHTIGKYKIMAVLMGVFLAIISGGLFSHSH